MWLWLPNDWKWITICEQLLKSPLKLPQKHMLLEKYMCCYADTIMSHVLSDTKQCTWKRLLIKHDALQKHFTEAFGNYSHKQQAFVLSGVSFECCSLYRSKKKHRSHTITLQRWKPHTVKWILGVTLLVCVLLSFAQHLKQLTLQ